MEAPKVDEPFQSLGKHLCRIEGDLVWLRAYGLMDVPDVASLIEICFGVCKRYGYALVLIDAAYLTGITSAARRLQADRAKELFVPTHTATYGAGILIRTLLIMIHRAHSLITGKERPVSFCADEARAREQLDVARVKIRAEFRL